MEVTINNKLVRFNIVKPKKIRFEIGEEILIDTPEKVQLLINYVEEIGLLSTDKKYNQLLNRRGKIKKTEALYDSEYFIFHTLNNNFYINIKNNCLVKILKLKT